MAAARSGLAARHIYVPAERGFHYTRTMNGIQSLYSVAIALCVFSTGILSGRRIGSGRPLRFFTAYLALESLCFLFELLAAHPATPMKALWLGLLMMSSLLVAPCLWLAIKESVEHERPSLNALGPRHRAAILLGAIFTVPLIATMHSGTEFVNPDRATPTPFEPLVHETMLLCIGIFALQVPYYLWRCRQLIVQNGNGAQLTWLQMPLVIVCTTWLLGLIRTLTAALSDAERPVFAIAALVDIGVTIGCVYLIVKKISASESVRAPGHSAESPPGTADSKYAKCQIDEAVRFRIVRKLKKAFSEEAIYCDPNLSLGSLSRRLNESEHYVSQVLNRELGASFYELVSRYRITHAQRMLTESPERTVLDVALEVGFNAKSTFNSAFRRHTGMTPREFRARTREGQPAQAPADATDSRL